MEGFFFCLILFLKVIGAQKKAGIWVRVGFLKTTRPKSLNPFKDKFCSFLKPKKSRVLGFSRAQPEPIFFWVPVTDLLLFINKC